MNESMSGRLRLRSEECCFCPLKWLKLCVLKGFLVSVGPRQTRTKPDVTSDLGLKHCRIMRARAFIVPFFMSRVRCSPPPPSHTPPQRQTLHSKCEKYLGWGLMQSRSSPRTLQRSQKRFHSGFHSFINTLRPTRWSTADCS
ncbi:hypothetical protein FQA47_022006 [Oryzias melastigma]|uniref:Uncharacterized protein n=1 Tax=Oryzias melastigma TaxID=30732 RepID=A0A834L1V2_ORYME|nr:hypothetical protein FQA47_022006 [Oryzias melastigma]